MKKSLKTQLFAAIAMMVVAAIALTSVGYAWFTAVANPKVETIDLYVKADDSMYLSAMSNPNILNPAEWSALIDKSDISGTSATGHTWQAPSGSYTFPTAMINLSSTMKSGTFYEAGFSEGGVINRFSLHQSPDANTASSISKDGTAAFTAFDLWATSTNNGYIYIDETSLVKAISALGSTTALESSPNKSIEQTVRIAFVPLDYDANGAATGNGDGTFVKVGNDPKFSADGTVKTPSWDHAVIWEPNAKDHLSTQYGGSVATSETPYDASSSLTDLVLGSYTAIDGKVQTKAVNNVAATVGELEGAVVNQTTYTHGINTNVGTEPDDLNKIALFNLCASSKQQFRVYIWVEGQDCDTVNAVAKNYFMTKFSFRQMTDEAIPGSSYAFS